MRSLRITLRATEAVQQVSRGPLRRATSLDAPAAAGRHIALAEPVLHPALLSGDEGPLARFAGLRRASALRVARCIDRLVLSHGGASVYEGQRLDPRRAAELAAWHPSLVTATGSSAIESLWRTLDLDPRAPEGRSRDAARRHARRRAWLAAHGPAPRTVLLGAIPVPRDASRAHLRRLDALRRANDALRQSPCDEARAALFDAVRAAWRQGLRDLVARARAAPPLRVAPCVDGCVPDPTLDLDAVGVSLDLAAVLLGRRVHDHLVESGRARDLRDAVELCEVEPAARRAAVEALLPRHPVALVREAATTPWHVAALRPTLRDATLALHPARLSHLCADEDLRVSPVFAVMPYGRVARASLASRVGEAPSLPPARGALARWRRGEVALDVSLCLDDLRPATERDAIVDGARARVAEVEAQFDEGVITCDERYNKVVDLWSEAVERVHQAWRTSTPAGHPLRALEAAGVVGASTARALVSTRGLFARPDGEIREVPALRSLADGATPHEFFVAAVAARCGHTARDARRARADDLLRRLARRLSGTRVTEPDCGASRGVEITRGDGGYDETRFARRLRGRAPVADVVDPRDGAVLARRGVTLDDGAARAIDASSLDGVIVRSPALCGARGGLCAVCAGPADPRERHAGLAAALRIGHLARSLERRVFHIGC